MKIKSTSKESLVHVALITLAFALSIQITLAEPPVILSANASEDGSTVTVVANEPVDEMVAEDTFNYVITGSDGSFRGVDFATLAADQQTLTLVVAPSLLPRVSYTLEVAFVCNLTFECSGPLSVPITFESIPPNRPPVANSQSVIAHANTPTPITLTGSDPDGDPLTFMITSSPTHGALSGMPPNVTYTPQSGYVGPDSFAFKVNDSLVDSAPATVSIEVRTLLVATGAVWKYLDTGIDPGTAWIGPSYNDTSWLMGPSELGFGDFDETTVIRSGTLTAPLITAYFRHTFTVADLSNIGTLSLQLWRDDGAIVYVNGVEVLRNNMPTGPVTYSTLASSHAFDDGHIPVTAQLSPSLLVSGANLIAVEVHQDTRATNNDLSFNLQLEASAAPNPPDLVSAAACGLVVTATFDEALDPPPAGDLFNYVIVDSDGFSSLLVVSATLESDQRTVTLNVDPSSPFLPGVSYTLVASYICDTSGDCFLEERVPIQFDTTAPTVTCNVAVNTLFPPNDLFMDVGLTATASDGTLQVRIFSDEPELSEATDTIFEDGVLRLRARRQEKGNGRVYLIVVTATDACGNIGACCKTVVVPHDHSKAATNSVNAQAAAAAAQCSPQGAPSTPFEILPGPGTFALSRDFSPNSNPAGAWTHGYQATLGGPFVPFTLFKYNFDPAGVPVEVWAISEFTVPAVQHNATTQTVVTDGGQGVYPPGTVWFYPGPSDLDDGGVDPNDNYGVIRFTVPAGGAGIYALESAVRSAYTGPISGDTDFHVLHNGIELFGQFLPAQGSTAFSPGVSLAVGDTIDFVIGRGLDNSFHGSGLIIDATLSRVQ